MSDQTIRKSSSSRTIRTNNSESRSATSYNDTLVYAIGGLGEVGKNMYCIEHEDEIIIIDAGVRFAEEELLGIDYVIPDYTYLIQNKHKIKALIITHGHEDHIGGIPFLAQAIPLPPIYAPKLATALIQRKMEERKVRNLEITEITAESKVSTEHFVVGFFNQVHSVPDCLGIIVNTPNGRIVSTGDFKFDLTPVGNNISDFQKMADIGYFGVTLLMSDSTNSTVEGFTISEKKVSKSIMEIFKNTRGRLIVATFASNVHRVQQICESAVANNRKIAIMGRSMENVITIGQKLGYIKVPTKFFINPEEINRYPANELCIICTGSQGEELAALSRIANGTHRYVKVFPGDTVVFSSSPIPGNAISVNGVVNKLTRAGANVLVNSPLNSLHTSGHASQDEQKLMLQLIKPKYFMPMHGEYKMLKVHKETAIETGIPEENIFICANGDVIHLRNGEAFLGNKRIQADDIYVDGNDTSGLSTAVLRDRKILADNGLVSVVVAIDSRTNSILSRPMIVTRGFVYIKESGTLIKEAENVVFDALKKTMSKKTTFGEIKNSIRNSLGPFLYQKTRRNPIVIPVVLNRRLTQEDLNNLKAKKDEAHI
ncbi:MAG: ribonuclease J [Erysipelotrichales bacterium]|nr:ribonuclease J [Erysipelotrichales bacterium]